MIFLKLRKLRKLINILDNPGTFIKDYIGFTRDKDIIYKLKSGLKILVEANTYARYIFSEIFVNDYYMKHFKISEGDTVIDIGANTGMFSMFAYNENKTGKIYAFEPEKNNFKYLLLNKELNNAETLIPINFGVTAKNETRKLYLSKNNCGKHSLCKEMKDFTKISCLNLNDFIKERIIEKIDLLKMDCEGSEYEIFNSLTDETFNKIKKITLEYHKVDGNHNGEMIKQLLLKKKFNVIKENTFLYAYKLDEDEFK